MRATTQRQAEDDNTPERPDEAPIELNVNRAFYAASATSAMVTCCVPRGSQPHGARAVPGS